jgi:hypothetical protein
VSANKDEQEARRLGRLLADPGSNGELSLWRETVPGGNRRDASSLVTPLANRRVLMVGTLEQAVQVGSGLSTYSAESAARIRRIRDRHFWRIRWRIRDRHFSTASGTHPVRIRYASGTGISRPGISRPGQAFFRCLPNVIPECHPLVSPRCRNIWPLSRVLLPIVVAPGVRHIRRASRS